MKSIEDTLGIIRDIIEKLPVEIEIALVGGYAAVLHGVERTTLDIDFCVYASSLHSSRGSTQFHDTLVRYVPERFEVKLIRGSSFHDDPFQHDVIFIEDKRGEFLRIDFLMARYKWELEAIRSAIHIQGIPVPVVTKPYLAAMKLRASGYKDASDVVTLLRLMTPEEKKETSRLAKTIGRDKKLNMLLTPPPEEPPEGVSEDLI